MRILVDLLHPAHVHVFRNLIMTMKERGDDVMITARDKDVTLDLLDAFGLDYLVISSQSSGSVGLISEWALRSVRLGRIARSFRPDVMTGIMGVSIAPVGRLLRIPSVVFYDTEWATTTNRVVYPLATTVVTPECYSAPVNGNHIRHPSYHELAYLHPTRFTPDPSIVATAGIHPNSPYSVVRFVSWEASHDRGVTSLSGSQKRDLVSRLSEHGRVVISSEASLPSELEPLVFRGPVDAIHHVLSFASVLAGDSATMAAEAAVLGTSSVFVSHAHLGYISDLETQYGLVRHFEPIEFDSAVDVSISLLDQKARESATRSRVQLLSDKADLTGWMLDFFEQFRRP